VSDTLTVAINHTHLHSVETSEGFETTGSFDIELENHGEAVHVHVHLDDALSEAASIDAINHHLRPGATRRIPVAVHDDERSVSGRLKVAAAYGAETRFVDLSLRAVRPTKPPVEVDAALGKPANRGPRSRLGSSSRSGSGSSRSSDASGSGSVLSAGVLGDRDGIGTPAAALGVAVLLLAILAVATIDSPLLLVGAFVVLAGAVVAGYVSLR
jgi:hypothetical protein